ncbi:bifunctional DNA primase/polymerase [Wenxinia saemankumensis]|uniref:Primase C terminal 2 (PriCT-2) n=1 Tax=Wenxinia saemankumensis TaxID=1447782 RepID=A0A1M6HQE4_9RHOB|nr:bifunctional DNA primase/polymerase [Wenxinia saemankumensis]SHJ24304.1 Primase C terminal 2 (PriCT-2) [Wenxinia saemankumensis]
MSNLKGYSIFPVGPDKVPLISGWQAKATHDPDVIAGWKAAGARAWGIPCGAANNVFVIDLDVDKQTGERIGEASLLALPRYAGLIDHAAITTPSGGRHIYFRHFDGARSSTSKLGPKIDTRGEGGFVVAPGSITAAGIYEGAIPDELPAVPFGLRAMLLQSPPAPARTTERETPTGEVQELLGHVSADLPYAEWVSVLMALHARYNGSDEGLAVADKWSATGAKYRAGEVAAKWRSFKRSGVTWATVPALARQHGADLSEIARRWAA